MLHAGQYRKTESQGKSVITERNVMQKKGVFLDYILVDLVLFAGGNMAIADSTEVVSNSQYSK